MAYVNRPDFGFYLSFEDPNNPAVTPTFVDFTCLFKSASAVARGRQYELGQTLAADPDVVLRDVNEYLNSANPSSPHYPNVDSYRRVLWMGTWPNTPIGNLFNPAYWGITGTVDPNLGPRDPSFESYTVGQAVPWISNLGGVVSVVGNVTPHAGTQDLTYTVVGSTTRQGIAFDMRCMPGRYYTVSVWLRQSSASVQQIIVDAPVGGSTSAVGAYNRLTQTFLATQPEHICFILTTGTAIAGTVLIDDIQMEQAPALNANINFQFAGQNWTPHGGAVAQNVQFYKVPEFSLKLTPDGVSATPFFESDRSTTAAVVGQQYIASGWIYSVAGTGSNQCDIRVNWYTSGNVLISNPTGTPAVLAAGTWTFFTTTFTAPATTAFVTVLGTITGTPAAANVVYFDQVQVVSATPSTFSTAGPTIYPIMANFAERFQKFWENGEFTGKVQIPCVDALTALSATKIPTEYVAAVNGTAPAWYYPLSATKPTSTAYPDVSGNNFAPVAPLASKYGTGPGLSGGTSLNIVGDPGGVGVGFTNTNTATLFGATGTILANGSVNRGTGQFSWPPLSSSWSASLAIWVVCAPVTIPAPDSQVLIQIVVPDNGQDLTQPISLAIGSNGQANVSFGGKVSGDFEQAGPVVTDGKPHLIVGTVTQDATNTTGRIYVDGLLRGTLTDTTASLGGLMTATGNALLIGGFFAYTAYEQIVSGSLAHASGWNRALSAGDVAALWTAGGLGDAGETTGKRMARHFAIGNYPAPYRISATTTSTLEPPTYTGNIDLGSDSANLAIAEGGTFWVAPDGAPVFESRQDRWLRLAPLWTLGNGPGNPHFAEPEYDTDPTYVYATVQVTRNGGATATGGLAADIVTAGHRYFGRTYTANVDLQTDAQAQDMANFVFYTHCHTLQRIAALILDPASNPTLWALVLGIEIGNRVRVIFTSPAANGGAGFTNTADFFVENVTHDAIDMDAGTWTTALLMSPIGAVGGPATMQPFILDNASFGVLNLNVLGW